MAYIKSLQKLKSNFILRLEKYNESNKDLIKKSAAKMKCKKKKKIIRNEKFSYAQKLTTADALQVLMHLVFLVNCF